MEAINQQENQSLKGSIVRAELHLPETRTQDNIGYETRNQRLKSCPKARGNRKSELQKRTWELEAERCVDVASAVVSRSCSRRESAAVGSRPRTKLGPKSTASLFVDREKGTGRRERGIVDSRPPIPQSPSHGMKVAGPSSEQPDQRPEPEVPSSCSEFQELEFRSFIRKQYYILFF